MSIAAEMDAPLFALAIAHARLAKRPGNEDLCVQIVAAQQHLEELRLAVLALEELAIRPRRPPGPPATIITLHPHRPPLHLAAPRDQAR